MSEDKKKALELAISQIEKQFGKGAIMNLGKAPIAKVDAIPTGALSLDLALGVGGVPRGRIIEIFGPESSGKSTLALNIVSMAQKQGGTAAYVDAENAMDAEYAKRIGVNIDELYISQPDCGEQGLEIVETLVRSGAVDVIVVDSVAALVPRAEIEGDMGDAQMGLQARLMSQAMRKLTGIINKSQCIVIFINQLREKIGVMFGNPETTPGGRALKFYSSVRIDIRRIETIKKGDAHVGNRVKAKVVKNKVAPPFREAIFDIIFGKGILREPALLEAAEKYEVVEKSGTWYSYAGKKIGQGKDSAITYLAEHPDVADDLEKKTREKFAAMEKANMESGPKPLAPEVEDDLEDLDTVAETKPGKETKEAKETKGKHKKD
ncbi:MAG: recombinase RecA [bacterium]